MQGLNMALQQFREYVDSRFDRLDQQFQTVSQDLASSRKEFMNEINKVNVLLVNLNAAIMSLNHPHEYKPGQTQKDLHSMHDHGDEDFAGVTIMKNECDNVNKKNQTIDLRANIGDIEEHQSCRSKELNEDKCITIGEEFNKSKELEEDEDVISRKKSGQLKVLSDEKDNTTDDQSKELSENKNDTAWKDLTETVSDKIENQSGKSMDIAENQRLEEEISIEPSIIKYSKMGSGRRRSNRIRKDGPWNRTPFVGDSKKQKISSEAEIFEVPPQPFEPLRELFDEDELPFKIWLKTNTKDVIQLDTIEADVKWFKELYIPKSWLNCSVSIILF